MISRNETFKIQPLNDLPLKLSTFIFFVLVKSNVVGKMNEFCVKLIRCSKKYRFSPGIGQIFVLFELFELFEYLSE